MKLIHITVSRRLSHGQRKQLKYEATAGSKMSDATWDTLVLHTEKAIEPFEKQIPTLFRPMFLRNFYGWVYILQVSKAYDFVLMRHPTFDPFVYLFAPFVPNRISVHHAKEVGELLLIRRGIAGRLASAVERFTGKFSVRRVVGILGVTGELSEYQCTTRAPGKPCTVYPNGIDIDEVDVLADKRSPQDVNLAFICGKFSAWHGLDRLVKAVDFADISSLPGKIYIHLIGSLSDEQVNAVNSSKVRRDIFIAYGTLPFSEYRRILEKCDLGIGSLAMDRQNLREGATLKVRELLAMGIPVYSGHQDTALPAEFRYYKNAEAVDLAEIIEYAFMMKNDSRIVVRNASIQYISKIEAMQKVVDWISQNLMDNRYKITTDKD